MRESSVVAARRGSLSPGMSCKAVPSAVSKAGRSGLQQNRQRRAVLHSLQGAVDDASRKFSRHLACEGCSAIPSG